MFGRDWALVGERLNVLVPLALGRVLIWHMEKDVDFSMTEVKAVSQFLDDGIPLAGARFLETRFLRISFEEWTSADAES